MLIPSRGKIHYTIGNTMASAHTLPLDRSGDYYYVTGTTNIERLATMGRGQQIILEFTNTTKIVHSIYINTPNGADMQFYAGDTVRLAEIQPSQWRVLDVGAGNVIGSTGSFTSPKSSASAGDRVDVNGDFTENITGWSGTNWAWDASNGGCALHTAGSTQPLVGTVPVEEGKYYWGEVSIADNNGTISIQIGTFTIPMDEDNYLFTTSGEFTGGLKAYGTGDADVTITPSSAFSGSINYIRFHEVVEALPAVYIYDDLGTDACDIMVDATLENQFMGRASGFQAVDGGDNIAFGKHAGESLVSGDHNTFVGKNAGVALTMGDYNTCIGSEAGAKIVTGCANTLIGKDAGSNIVSSMRNTCIGRNSGNAITTGDNNTCVGPHSGTTLTTGENNTFIGPYTGNRTTDDDRNIFIGPYAGHIATGDDGIFIGNEAGYSNDGQRNTGIGIQALYSITNGSENVAVGRLAGKWMTEGSHNILLGNAAGYEMTTGAKNFIAGYLAGYDATTASNTIAIGDEALTNLTTGNENIAIGTKSLHALTTGTENVCLGDDSGQGITTNSYNVCVGASAGRVLATGDYNILIGRSARYNGTGTSNVIIGDEAASNGAGDADHNVIIGDAAGEDVTTASYNVIVGKSAAKELVATDGNVIVGYNAATTTSVLGNNTSSVNCTVIGAGTKTFGTSDDNNIVIGYGAIATAGSNTTVIGTTTTTDTKIWGDLDLPDGQISFPATQNASADVNTLDDYEEGTFTPAAAFGTDATGISYGDQLGVYTKIGRQVTATGRLTLTNSGSKTGNFFVTGLPFTSLSTSNQKTAACVTTFNIASSGFITGRVNENDTRIEMFECNTSGTRSNLIQADVANNGAVEFMVTYFV